MLFNVKGSKVQIGDTDMDYVVFGQGTKPLIIIPGLGDGLKTVKGQGMILAKLYKLYGNEFQVYIFSRKNVLPHGYTTRDMARDQKIAMEQLGISDAYVMGISQGGMIAQYLAIDYPEAVKKLIIGVSISKQNERLQEVVKGWIQMAEINDYKNLVIDTMEKTFTDDYLKKYRPIYPIIGRVSRPKSFERFMIQANACLSHNAYNELYRIQCPTLVIGGDCDQVVGKNASEEMAEMIQESKLVIYEGLGHGAYQEAKDFNEKVMEFLLDETL